MFELLCILVLPTASVKVKCTVKYLMKAVRAVGGECGPAATEVKSAALSAVPQSYVGTSFSRLS